MTEYKFFLNDFEIEEPQGWADIVLALIRDPEWHGVGLQATVNELGFFGIAASYLESEKLTKGLKANVIFLAQEACGEDGVFEQVLKGRLNFGRYKQTCGDTCFVTMPVEQEGCQMTFRNRYDQAVDIDSSVAFDRITNLTNYAGLGFDMELAAQEFDARVKGSVGTLKVDTTTAEMGPMASNGIYIWAQNFRPTYFDEQFNSIQTGSLVPNQSFAATQYNRDFKIISEDFMTPQLLFDDNLKCYAGSFAPSVLMSLKGTVQVHSDTDDYGLVVTVYFVKYKPVLGLPFPNYLELDPAAMVLQKHVIYNDFSNNPNDITIPFDYSFGSPALPVLPGESIYGYVQVYAQVNDEPPQNMTATVIFDPTSTVDIRVLRSCPPTEAQVYMVNETFSRVVEAVTNNCIKVKSNYYGRTDSQPYSSSVDGCGSLRVLLNGLKLRKADTDKMFLSLQDMYEGLRGIDNIGMVLEPNPELPGFDWLRVEHVDYFYQDVEVLRLPYVPRATIDVDESKHYSLVKIGYNKWEPKAVGGLDEFNSTREYRTSLETVKTTLDVTSNFIAAGTVIETTRQQSFVETGAADTTYDNDNFIIVVERGVYGYKVEQGIITNDANIFSPGTVYNYRISPLRNLFRWFKSIANSYANIADSAAKLFFSSGTGNYTATGRITDPCSPENGAKAENKDLSITDFLNTKDYLPLYKPENLTATYPFTKEDMAKIKQNPHGYISVQCGDGAWYKGFITELQWRVKDGMAEFKLKLKW